MGIEIIGKLTQKNNGDFKLVDLADVDYDGTGKSAKQELEKKIEEAKNSSTPYDDTEIKTDINTIKTDLGTEELTTTAKDVKGAVNEVVAQYKDIAKKTIVEGNKLYLVKADGTKLDSGTALPTSSGTVTDGKEIELQKSTTHIQWRYVGDTNWINLVALSDLKGAKGEKGATGATPNLKIGTVTTLESGSNATANITGNTPNLTLNLGIPKGADGSDGAGGAADSIDWSNVQNKPTIPTKTSELTNDSDFITASTADSRYRKTSNLLTMNDLGSDVKAAMTGSTPITPTLSLNQVLRNNLSLDMFKKTYQQLNVVIDDSVTTDTVITLKLDISNIPDDVIKFKFINPHYDISTDGFCYIDVQGYYTYTGETNTTSLSKKSVINDAEDELNVINSNVLFGSRKDLTIDSVYLTLTLKYKNTYSKKFNIDIHSLYFALDDKYYYPLKISEITHDEGLTVTLNSDFGKLPNTDISSVVCRNEFSDYKLNTAKHIKRALGTQLEGKTWLAFGDSITKLAGSYFETGIHKYGMFLDYFKQDTTSSVNKAISGNNSEQQLTVMQNYERTNFDYISIMIGRNDMSTDIEALRSTFETICDTMISKYSINGSKIFVILTIPTTGTGTTSLEDIVNMQKEVCYAKNIPCLDLYHQGGFYVQNESFRGKYIPDGTHPNALGSETFLVDRIMKFMINL